MREGIMLIPGLSLDLTLCPGRLTSVHSLHFPLLVGRRQCPIDSWRGDSECIIHREGEIWADGTCDLFVANRQLSFDFLNHTNILCLTMLTHPKKAVRCLRLCTIVIDYTCLDGIACYTHLLSWMLSLAKPWLIRTCLYLYRIICSASWDISQDSIQFWS